MYTFVLVHSKVTVTTAITTMPMIKAINCLSDSFGSSSFRRSGRTVTKAMCRNVPAVNGRIHEVLASAEKPIPVNTSYTFEDTG